MTTIKRYIGKFRKPLRWRGWKRFARYFLLPVVTAALLLVVTRGLLVTQLSLPADRADLGLMAGDRLLINCTAFGLRMGGTGTHRQPERGDIVVFGSPDGQEGLHIGRVTALPGDTAEGRRLPEATYRIDGTTVTHDRLRGRAVCVSYSTDAAAPLHRRFRRDRFFFLLK